MPFADAKVADLLRCSQRDEAFIMEMQDHMQSILKLFGAKNYHDLRRIMPGLAGGWYYFVTTLANLQTLGEEYTGIIRLDGDNRVPSGFLELLWLIFHIGGEPLLDRLVKSFRSKVENSSTLTSRARRFFLNVLDFIKEHKQNFKRLHHSLFYIDGKYYNIANRITGIKYVLVRQWLQDDTFTQSFRVLGYASLLYILYSFSQQLWSSKSSGNIAEISTVSNFVALKKGCVLCGESRKNASSTFCGHIFCWDCIYDSLSYQRTCPMCREIVTPNRVILLQNYG